MLLDLYLSFVVEKEIRYYDMVFGYSNSLCISLIVTLWQVPEIIHRNKVTNGEISQSLGSWWGTVSIIWSKTLIEQIIRDVRTNKGEKITYCKT